MFVSHIDSREKTFHSRPDIESVLGVGFYLDLDIDPDLDFGFDCALDFAMQGRCYRENSPAGHSWRPSAERPSEAPAAP